MKQSPSNSRGFTLIELLVVITMIGALAGIGISLINPARSQGRAYDGIRLKNVKSMAEAIQSYRQLEGEFPADGDQNDPSSQLRTVYITKWPDPQSDTGQMDPDNWTYVYHSDGTRFLVYSPNSLGGCFKFQSDWARQLTCPVTECSDEFTDSAVCS